ncbi:CCC motif membrane protein [Tenacibaculum xiamenense]|uniref:CCC motif membrane protein n=1 Tax=Tenacibaculum xiamenense TaxID=1261553 RepID=UPI00389323CD
MNEFEQRQLPNATAVLVLGIISILSCCCYGIPGIILGVIALVLFKQDKNKYDLNPSLYTNYSNLNTGRILAIIGIALSVFYLIFIVGMIAVVGWDALQDPELLQERMNGW